MSRSLAAAVPFALLLLAAAPALAATPDELDRLHDALGTEELLSIMREEGLSEAEKLREEMFAGRPDGGWSRLADMAYDTARMSAIFRTGFDAGLADTDVLPLISFFESDLGKRIVRLELEGRRALMSPGVEDAARDAFARLETEDPDRVALLSAFVETNDLVEFNVMGAMNASVAFMRALASGGGFDMAEDEILADVWAQEPSIREDTSGWIYAYLAMAYQPLADADIRSYHELSETPAGRDLNTALFAGFDDVFIDVSRSLGLAASNYAAGEDL